MGIARVICALQSLAGALATLLLLSPAQAAVFNIPAGDVAALIAAITTANGNGKDDTINLAAGTYSLTVINNMIDGTNGLPGITSTLTIKGAGAEETIIERLANAPSFRILYVAKPGTLTLDGLTLRGGVAENTRTCNCGGGLYNNGGRVVVTNSAFVGNHAQSAVGFGGGLGNNGGMVRLTNSTLVGNDAQGLGGGGGGLANFYGRASLIDCSITENTAGDGSGGGLFNFGGQVSVSNGTLASNQAQVDGGGLYNESGAVTVQQSTISNNSAGFGGGLFSAADSTVALTDSTIANNRAQVGGGLWHQASGTLTLLNSALTGNHAVGEGGGGINGGVVIVTNSTIAGNQADSGGGLFNSGTVTLLNSTIAYNLATSAGGGLFHLFTDPMELQNTILAQNTATAGPDCHGLVNSRGNNLLGDPAGCNVALLQSDLTGDPGLGQFVDPGIPGQGRLPLLPYSPGIDAGNAKACPSTDQLARPRSHSHGLPACDIGAVEFFPIVNDLMTLAPELRTSFDAAPVPHGPAGTFTITATFTNTSNTPLRTLFFGVGQLTGGHLVLNADGGPGGVGATVTPEVAGDVLAPGASVTGEFVIGLQDTERFRFFIDLLGEPL